MAFLAHHGLEGGSIGNGLNLIDVSFTVGECFLLYGLLKTPSKSPRPLHSSYLTFLISEHKHVALKICRSDKETSDTAAAEIAILKHTIWQGKSHDHIVALLDDFTVPVEDHPKLSHACLVFELLGPNLLTFLESHMDNVRSGGNAQRGEGGGLPLSLVKIFAKQMLLGTAYLHDFCRHIHTDLKVRVSDPNASFFL